MKNIEKRHVPVLKTAKYVKIMPKYAQWVAQNMKNIEKRHVPVLKNTENKEEHVK